MRLWVTYVQRSFLIVPLGKAKDGCLTVKVAIKLQLGKENMRQCYDKSWTARLR